MIWSPLSNLLLYGATADIGAGAGGGRAARARAGLVAERQQEPARRAEGRASRQPDCGSDSLSDFDLLSLATRNAAKILRWDKHLGTLEPGKRADLLVVAGDGGDGHAHLFTRSEHDVELVVINGVPRYGASQVMRDCSARLRRRLRPGRSAGAARLWSISSSRAATRLSAG